MRTTLDEGEIMQAIVQLGGFAPAAKQLNRSQSTISCAIARLQKQLGIRLFEIKGRRADLAELGRVLLDDAESHLSGFHQLEQRARSPALGSESEVRLSVDSSHPNRRLFEALAGFACFFPQSSLNFTRAPSFLPTPNSPSTMPSSSLRPSLARVLHQTHPRHPHGRRRAPRTRAARRQAQTQPA
jgi:DNA-binding transcriptional LysR family regulator